MHGYVRTRKSEWESEGMNDGDDDADGSDDDDTRRRGRKLSLYVMATTAACGDDDCELRGWLTMPG